MMMMMISSLFFETHAAPKPKVDSATAPISPRLTLSFTFFFLKQLHEDKEIKGIADACRRTMKTKRKGTRKRKRL